MWILCRVIDYCEIWRVWWVALTPSVWIHNKQSVYYVNGSVGERECLTTIDKRKSTRDSFYNIILYMFFFCYKFCSMKNSDDYDYYGKNHIKILHVRVPLEKWMMKVFCGQIFCVQSFISILRKPIEFRIKVIGNA